ncbi:putative cyclin-dependent protein [Blattamonas nauphoetae]|uniref:Cyclin-dependent protein n=1 Tax=Blattamonas nauphoetae TaxID=2049346 RepID=A0ABQ9XPQ3_9EUKA|nr:putative cyclin-dependent protein [Blattamonas nauphoetae]
MFLPLLNSPQEKEAFKKLVHPSLVSDEVFYSTILEQVLDELQRNDSNHPVSTINTPFHGNTPATITPKYYLERLFKYMRCKRECFLYALVFIVRYLDCTHVVLSTQNVHRLLLVSLVIAIKFLDDVYYSNVDYARLGGLSVKELNSLEIHFLVTISFSLHIEYDTFFLLFDKIMRSIPFVELLPFINVPADISQSVLSPCSQPNYSSPPSLILNHTSPHSTPKRQSQTKQFTSTHLNTSETDKNKEKRNEDDKARSPKRSKSRKQRLERQRNATKKKSTHHLIHNETQTYGSSRITTPGHTASSTTVYSNRHHQSVSNRHRNKISDDRFVKQRSNKSNSEPFVPLGLSDEEESSDDTSTRETSGSEDWLQTVSRQFYLDHKRANSFHNQSQAGNSTSTHEGAEADWTPGSPEKRRRMSRLFGNRKNSDAKLNTSRSSIANSSGGTSGKPRFELPTRIITRKELEEAKRMEALEADLKRRVKEQIHVHCRINIFGQKRKKEDQLQQHKDINRSPNTDAEIMEEDPLGDWLQLLPITNVETEVRDKEEETEWRSRLNDLCWEIMQRLGITADEPLRMDDLLMLLSSKQREVRQSRRLNDLTELHTPLIIPRLSAIDSVTTEPFTESELESLPPTLLANLSNHQQPLVVHIEADRSEKPMSEFFSNCLDQDETDRDMAFDFPHVVDTPHSHCTVSTAERPSPLPTPTPPMDCLLSEEDQRDRFDVMDAPELLEMRVFYGMQTPPRHIRIPFKVNDRILLVGETVCLHPTGTVPIIDQTRNIHTQRDLFSPPLIPTGNCLDSSGASNQIT